MSPSESESGQPDLRRVNCYDYPQYWDMAFHEETNMECDFFEVAAKHFCNFPVKNVLEPACGGGRLLVEMAQRGYAVHGFDLSQPSIDWLDSELAKRNLSGTTFVGDMTDFTVDQPMDLVFNTMNTFRHLLTEEDAEKHLQCVADCLQPGGLFILGFHLLPPDADEEDEEAWSTTAGDVTVDLALLVTDFCRDSRIEKLSFELDVNDDGKQFKLVSEYAMRLYTADQFKSLLAKVPNLELMNVYDFWYEIDAPLEFDDDRGDAVFVFRKRA